jgi:hypothetical protein
MGFHGKFMEFHGIQWNSIELNGIPLNNSMENFHGIPWNYETEVDNSHV